MTARVPGRGHNAAPSRRTVMAWVGHWRAAVTTASSGEASGSTTHSDGVVVEFEDPWRSEHAVARPHARVAVDVDLSAHGAMVGPDGRCKKTGE